MRIAVICGIVLIGLATLLFTYLLPWARFNPAWTIKQDEKIDSVEFGVFESPDKATASALVYLVTDSGRRKLRSADILRVNDHVLKPQYYNNGTAVGYKYLADIEIADTYVLSLQRSGQEAIKKTINKNQIGETITFDLK